ncbi:transposable element Tcb1 transposase [Trichonephila clavipes]|nr:transposable element Tcb1 transposase [Trichonephila clavipes]
MAHSIDSKPLLLKNFNLHEILNYSAKFSSATGNRNVAANISKGLKLFDDKFVISATCTCPAGGTPAFCKHVFALLHAINDYIAKKLYEAPTERLQTWHQPKPVKMVPQTSEEVFMREPAIAVENEIGEIGSRIGRNQTTVMRICDRWMQEGTMDRRGRSHSPQCTTSREDRQFVRIAVTDRSVTSRAAAQHIESVTHHLVSKRTILRRLQQSGLSASRPLLGLPLTQNHRHLRRQWSVERRMGAAEWNEVVFTHESRICMQHHDGRIRV